MKEDTIIKSLTSDQDPITQAAVDGYLLSAPQSFFAALFDGSDQVSGLTNGCGPRGIGDRLVPDRLWGLSIRHACVIHDWTFAVWRDRPGFDLANTLFRNNMQRVVSQACDAAGNSLWQRFLRDRRMALTVVYYHAVCRFGERYYFDDY